MSYNGVEDVPPRLAGLIHHAIIAFVVLTVLVTNSPDIIFNPIRSILKPQAQTGTMPFKSAKDFTAGVCVNAHWYFGSTPYTVSYASMKSAIQDLNITCARDQWNPASSTQTTRFNDLSASGIKHTVIIDRRRFNDETADRTAADTDASGAVSTAEAIDHLLDNAPGSVLSLEGPNELLATDCADAITTAQEIWAVKQSDSRLANIPILSPAAAQPTENSCLGDLSAYTDEGNIHSYPGDSNPEAIDRGSNVRLTGWMSHVRNVVGASAPVTATETGYHNATSYTGGHEPVTETADGKYMSQLYFAYQLAGVHRIYKYELVNQVSNPALDNNQYHFGYLRNDLTQKPSYVSVNNFMDLLVDSSQPSLTALNYSVTGTPANFRQMLLQKSDGSHWLAMWNNIDIYDPTTEVDLSPADVNVSLTVPSSKIVNIYRPYSGASPTTTRTGGTFNVPINADVTLVKVSSS